MPRLRLFALLWVLCSCLPGLAAHAEPGVPFLMLSDIHFDPFHNPSQLAQLRTQPVERWAAILEAAPSPADAATLQALQTNCRTRALDTDWPLFRQALTAAHLADAHPLFLTVSGDLLTHDFACRFLRLAPGANAQDVAAFAAKTVTFTLLHLREAFPGIPVYVGLGNNDSGCSDYRATPGDLFLTEAAAAIRVAAFDPALAITPEVDYTVQLPAPLNHIRLIVLNDLFASRQFATCSNGADRTPERTQIDWLRAELAAARARNEQVWFMSHLPPGIDVYDSYRRFLFQPAAMCSATPRPYLADTTLADALLDFSDIVRLAIFGHTHMDEVRLLTGAGSGTSPSAAPAIPVKLVPSISPFAGNHPAFLLAEADPHTGVLKDWRTIVSPGPDGSTPPWSEAYRFSKAYHLPDFSAESVRQLADGFVADKTGQSPTASALRQHLYPGDFGLYAAGVAQIWPAYACAIRENRPSRVQSCICGLQAQP